MDSGQFEIFAIEAAEILRKLQEMCDTDDHNCILTLPLFNIRNIFNPIVQFGHKSH